MLLLLCICCWLCGVCLCVYVRAHVMVCAACHKNVALYMKGHCMWRLTLTEALDEGRGGWRAIRAGFGTRPSAVASMLEGTCLSAGAALGFVVGGAVGDAAAPAEVPATALSASDGDDWKGVSVGEKGWKVEVSLSGARAGLVGRGTRADNTPARVQVWNATCPDPTKHVLGRGKRGRPRGGGSNGQRATAGATVPAQWRNEPHAERWAAWQSRWREAPSPARCRWPT